MPKFKSDVLEEGAVHFGTDITEQGEHITLLFDNLYIALKDQQQTPTATMLKTFRLPLDESKSNASASITVKGFLAREPGTIALLGVYTGGNFFQIDLPLGTGGEVNFEQCVQVAVAPGANFMLMLILLLDRRSDDMAVQGELRIDSVLVELAASKQSSPC